MEWIPLATELMTPEKFGLLDAEHLRNLSPTVLAWAPSGLPFGREWLLHNVQQGIIGVDPPDHQLLCSRRISEPCFGRFLQGIIGVDPPGHRTDDTRALSLLLHSLYVRHSPPEVLRDSICLLVSCLRLHFKASEHLLQMGRRPSLQESSLRWPQ